MTQSQTRSISAASPAEAAEFLTTDTRIDPPHATADAEIEAARSTDEDGVATDQPLLEVDESDAFEMESIETLRNQARQLSLLLRERHESLDRREAEWQAQLAQHEKATRAARLWLEARRDELTERETALAARETEIETRFAQLQDAETACEALHAEREAKLLERRTNLEVREVVVGRRETELNELLTKAAIDAAAQQVAREELAAERAALAAQASNLECEMEERLAARARLVDDELIARRLAFQEEIDGVRRESTTLEERRLELERLAAEPSEFQRRLQAELDEQAAALEAREAELTAAEVCVRQGLVDVERLQAECREEQQRLAEQQRRDRLGYAEQRRRLETELDEARRALERQNEQLDFRRAAVQQEQAEVAATQRETLEMRIAVEELWTQLAGSVPAAALTENLARVRGRLAEQYRLQQHELAASRSELETLRTDLAAEGAKLRIQTAELRRWVEARHEEIERQAAFLTAREAELERQDVEQRRQSAAWRQERGRLEQEVRRLETELRRASREVAAS